MAPLCRRSREMRADDRTPDGGRQAACAVRTFDGRRHRSGHARAVPQHRRQGRAVVADDRGESAHPELARSTGVRRGMRFRPRPVHGTRTARVHAAHRHQRQPGRMHAASRMDEEAAHRRHALPDLGRGERVGEAGDPPVHRHAGPAYVRAHRDANPAVPGRQ